ncbi:MAG: hypothetical protein EOO38_00850 [Cytophagaceae bacterium]|nr:MAG: hypothetical protein EOO38_00850 [Cytophagaceae bacterium]
METDAQRRERYRQSRLDTFLDDAEGLQETVDRLAGARKRGEDLTAHIEAVANDAHNVALDYQMLRHLSPPVASAGNAKRQVSDED